MRRPRRIRFLRFGGTAAPCNLLDLRAGGISDVSSAGCSVTLSVILVRDGMRAL
jgi:hypothetical protein